VRREVILAICSLALVSGCSRKTPPMKMSALKAPAPRVGTAATDPDALSGGQLGNAASPAIQTKMAERWGERLTSSNPTTASDAAAALGAMGEYGYPHLLKGMQGSSEELRIACMKSMHVSQLVAHQNDTMPILIEMLRDPNPGVRCAAVSRLPWYGRSAGRYMQFVQAMANNDPDASVRAAAALSVNGLYEAMTGKVITGGPDDPKIR
jgi:hypothetical protein